MGILLGRTGTTTVEFAQPQELIVSHLDDSIKVGDGVDLLAINADGSVNTTVVGGSITIGSGDVSTVETGVVATAFNEITALVPATLTTIVSYTATQPTRVKLVEVSGTNIAEYTVTVNGAPVHKKRTYFGNLDNAFNFSKGLNINATDVIAVHVLHNQTSTGDFSGFILLLKD